ncbi:MAG: hypothetical protein ACOC1K_02575 [Nanoarchaeota archaeon]
MNKLDQLIDNLNILISICEPFSYEDFNKHISSKDEQTLIGIEKNNDKIGICKKDYDDPECKWGFSTLSLIATITDMLVDKRLSFIVDDGIITGVKWYEEN